MIVTEGRAKRVEGNKAEMLLLHEVGGVACLSGVLSSVAETTKPFPSRPVPPRSCCTSLCTEQILNGTVT
jgi:hypothetical protein